MRSTNPAEEGEKADPATAKPETIAPAEIREQPSVQKALAEAAPRAAADKKWKLPGTGWLFGAIAAALGLAYLLSDRRLALSWLTENEVARRGTLAALSTAALLAVRAFAIAVLMARLKRRVVRYNVLRVLKLAIALLIVLSAVSFLFVGWYGAVVSFGLLSLILGFALQAPITSFFAWVFILVRSPYRVGDRVRIGPKPPATSSTWVISTPRCGSLAVIFSQRIIRAAGSSVFQTPWSSIPWCSTIRGRFSRTSGTR